MKKSIKTIILFSFIGLSNLKSQTICTNDTIVSISNAPISDVFRTVAYGNDIYSFASQVSKYSTVNNNWSNVPNMPTVRVECGVSEVNGIIYTLGGWTGSPSNKNEAYNISTNTWSTMANLPSALTGCFAVSLNNKVYIIGGTLGTTTTSFYEYNPATNTYSTLTTPSQSRMHAGLVAYNNKIYFIGGHYYNGTYNSSNKLDEYDPSLNTWSAKTNIPVNIQRTNGTIYDNKLYLFGGTTATPTITPLNSFYVYDFLSDSWTTMPNLPFSRASFDPKTINGIVYLLGGHASSSTVTNLCYKYYCNMCFQTITVTDTLIINANLTGINPVTFQNSIKIYPNPTNSSIIIDFGNNYTTLNGYTLKITNSLSQIVYTTAITQLQTTVNLSTWTGNGIYFVHLIDAQSNTIDIRKIILQ